MATVIYVNDKQASGPDITGGGEGQLSPPGKLTKQGVYAIINHVNLKLKASVWSF